MMKKMYESSENIIVTRMMFLPIILIFIGLFYLAKYYGWIRTDFPFFPTLLLVIGVYWLIKSISLTQTQ